MWIDVGKLISQHVPDKNGNILPANLAMGGYQFQDLTNSGVGTLFEGKVIYDKTYGHVAYGCAICCGNRPPTCKFDPLGIPFPGNAWNGIWSYDTCAGQREDVSSTFDSWTIGNPNIATTRSDGYHTSVAVGSTFSNTVGDLPFYRNECPLVTYYPQCGDNVAALPTNFRPTSVSNQGNGVLIFVYQWDSTTGSLGDLSQCNIREYVAYPGTGNFSWPSPPYVAGQSPNPTVTNPPIPATDGSVGDQNSHPGFLKPYVYNQFSANQKFQYSCSNYLGGAWVDFTFAPGAIVRTVDQPSLAWRYTITKSGSSATTGLP
jgi:hypothetical protein